MNNFFYPNKSSYFLLELYNFNPVGYNLYKFILTNISTKFDNLNVNFTNKAFDITKVTYCTIKEIHFEKKVGQKSV